MSDEKDIIVVDNKGGKGNDKHYPAGSKKGGQFAPKDAVLDGSSDLDISSDDLLGSMDDFMMDIDELFSSMDEFLGPDVDENGNIIWNDEDIMTLRNFDFTREERKSDYYRTLDKEKEQAAKAKMKDVLENKTSFVRYFKGKRILSILESGKIASQLETGVYGDSACEYPTTRIKFTNKTFGCGISTYDADELRGKIRSGVSKYGLKYFQDNIDNFLTPSEQKIYNQYKSTEKYGMMAPADLKKIIKEGDTTGYGDGTTFVKFKKDRIFNRTTYTIGDSLGGSQLPIRLSDGFDKYCSYNPNYAANHILEKNFDNYDDFLLYDYFELQFHGDLGLDDMELICSKPDYWNSSDGKKSLKIMQDNGIKAYAPTRSRNMLEVSLEDGNVVFRNESGEIVPIMY